ncbi:MAG: hypothetical protein AAFQ94_27960 [Bacteroidota bacterium]
MHGIIVKSDMNNGFYVSSDSSIVKLIKLFIDYENNLEGVDLIKLKPSLLLKIKFRMELWIDVALKSRIDLVLNSNHPIEFIYKGEKTVLFQKNNSNDDIIIKVFSFYTLVCECIENTNELFIVEKPNL